MNSTLTFNFAGRILPTVTKEATTRGRPRSGVKVDAGVDTGDREEEKPPMLVCHCKRITDRQIRAAVQDGASSLQDVARKSGAALSCGGCARSLRAVVRSERARMASVPSGPETSSEPVARA